MKPQPAAQGVEWIAWRIAWSRLDLGILVRNQIPTGQFARPQSIVERGQVEETPHTDQQHNQANASRQT